MKEFRSRLKRILESMVGRVVTPGDVVALTGLPRYEVLATFHVLEALGVIEVINAKGNYRVYKLSHLGLELLNALQEGEELLITVAAGAREVVAETSSEGEVSAEA
ncbi:MAG: hypothetical protein J7J20_04865 [Desulfurococcales archaeon]|nr:hypothetical protein [Desulfurococcales archaeon]MCD6278617.1 hypothetical protein [Desulfurococcales archaeon]